MAKKP
ncbi:9edb73c6-9fcc-49eb-b08f-189bb2398acb [Thermothielavioides terrestris]